MSDSDKEIIQRVLEGDVRAFGLLVDKHKAKAMTTPLFGPIVRYHRLSGNRVSQPGSIGLSIIHVQLLPGKK